MKLSFSVLINFIVSTFEVVFPEWLRTDSLSTLMNGLISFSLPIMNEQWIFLTGLELRGGKPVTVEFKWIVRKEFVTYTGWHGRYWRYHGTQFLGLFQCFWNVFIFRFNMKSEFQVCSCVLMTTINILEISIWYSVQNRTWVLNIKDTIKLFLDKYS